MNYSIRELKRDENKILDTFLYEKTLVRTRETYVWLLKLRMRLLVLYGFGL